MYKQTRRQFLKKAGLMVGSAGIIGTPLFARRQRGKQDRPNILWITSEDNSPLLVSVTETLLRMCLSARLRVRR